MQSTSVSSRWPVCCYPIPNHHFCACKNLRLRATTTCYSFKNHTHFSLTAAVASSCSSSKEEENKDKDNHAFLEQLYSDTDNQILRPLNLNLNQEEEEEEESPGAAIQNCEGISSNMWWADFRAALGQRINLEGIVSSVSVLARDRHLALPHVAVPDIRYIDWAALKRKGFHGVVFDKDNTITAPYSLTLWGPLGSSMELCKLEFGNDIAVFSNSAGLHEYDPDGKKARTLEGAIGIKVIRHRVKKPAGTAEEIEEHFGCESSRLIMVGDRPFTDIVFGNRNDFLTILTAPLSLAEEPFIVKQVRKLEVAIVNRWCKRGLKPASHRLLQDPLQCVKDPSTL